MPALKLDKNYKNKQGKKIKFKKTIKPSRQHAGDVKNIKRSKTATELTKTKCDNNAVEATTKYWPILIRCQVLFHKHYEIRLNTFL